MNWKICILVNILFFLASCSHRQKEDNITLRHSDISSNNEYLIGSATSISLMDTTDSKSDSLFHFISINGKLIKDYGSVGQGPNDFLLPLSVTIINGQMGVYDINKKKYSIVDFARDTVTQTVCLRIQDSHPFLVYPIANEKYLTTGLGSKNRFSLLNDSGYIEKGFFDYPYRDEEEKEVADFIRAEVYQGKIAFTPQKDKFVQAISNAGIISFYKIEDGQIKLIKESAKTYPEYKYDKNTGIYQGLSPHTEVAYLDVDATEKNVYALYSGKNYADDQLNAFNGVCLFVYNWNGDLIKKYELDIPVSSFCVDGPNNIIYAIANKPDPVIVKFEME